MNLKKILQNTLGSALVLFALAGCEKNEQEMLTSNTLDVVTNSTIFVVNMGNYSESNGSISLLNYGEEVEQNIYSKCNGYPLRSIVESVTFYGNVALLMCGNEDKVEFVDRRTGKAVANAVTGIGLPRYATIVGKYAYVSCVNPTWRDTVGYITKIDMDSYTVDKRIRVKGNPEGITSIGNMVFAATANGVALIDANSDTTLGFIGLPNRPTATARYFVRDANGNLWLSFTQFDNYGNGKNCGIAKLKPGDSEFADVVELNKMNGDAYIDLSPDGRTLYYMYASEVVGGQSPEAETCIYAVDLASKAVSPTPVCSGHGFYGFNVDPSTGNIYTANVNGFITNSMISIFSQNGDLLQDNLMAGVGTCRFYF